MTPAPLERDIEKRITTYARSKGCLFEKFVSPAKRGVADRVIIAPGGAIGWLEVKRPGGKPTDLQHARMDEKRKLGCNVSWCDNAADGCKFVDSLIAEGARRKQGEKPAAVMTTGSSQYEYRQAEPRVSHL